MVFLYLESNRNADDKMVKNVKLDITYNEKVCSPSCPIYVVIKNKTNRKILEVDFKINAFLPSFSKNVNKDYRMFECDKIIEANSSYVMCYSLSSSISTPFIKFEGIVDKVKFEDGWKYPKR